MKRHWQWIARIGLLLAAVPALAQQPAKSLLIRGGTLIDGTGKPVQKDVSILVQGDIIQAVGTDLKVPEKAEVIDARGKFIIPGLIDGRVKLGPSPANHLSREEVDVAQQAQSLRAMLEAGVTTVRVIQGNVQDQLFYQRAWQANLLIGPRLVLAGPTFTAPNGHPAEEYKVIALHARDLQLREVSTVVDARNMTKDLALEGVQVFEVVYDAGLPAHPYPRMDKDVLKEIIFDAHAHHCKVFCAVSTNAEAVTAIQDGTDAIEGVWQEGLTDDTVSLMAQNHVFYMPALTDQGDLANLIDPESLRRYLMEPIVRKTISRAFRDSVEAPGGVLGLVRTGLRDQPSAHKEMEAQQKRAEESVKRAEAGGVPVIVGTDTGNLLIFPGAAVDRELQLMVKAGLTPMQALQAATRNAAESMGFGEEIGTVEKGKIADLVILAADPLVNIRNLERVDMVICDGRRLEGERIPVSPAASKAEKRSKAKAGAKGKQSR